MCARASVIVSRACVPHPRTRLSLDAPARGRPRKCKFCPDGPSGLGARVRQSMGVSVLAFGEGVAET
eukprot:11205533-Lingulodinium_polyedra.AAC.1